MRNPINVACKYYSLEKMVFDDLETAGEILDAMRDIASNFGNVTVMDYKDLTGDIGLASYRDNKYGWTKEALDTAHIETTENGCKNVISPAEYIGDGKEDLVNHPSHYKSKTGLETIDVIDAFTADLVGIEAVCTANVIKYKRSLINHGKNRIHVQLIQKFR